LSLKDNVKAIKNELNTEEQFLESMIKAEGFFKKYKKILIALVVIILALVIGYTINSSMKDSALLSSNEAYLKLLKDPDDKTAIATLKDKNPPLYEAFIFSQALKSGNLDGVESKIKDGVLKDLLNYHVASKNEKNLSQYIMQQDAILKELALLEEAYLLMRENKIKEAKDKLRQISPTSPIKGLAQNLSHFGK